MSRVCRFYGKRREYPICKISDDLVDQGDLFLYATRLFWTLDSSNFF